VNNYIYYDIYTIKVLCIIIVIQFITQQFDRFWTYYISSLSVRRKTQVVYVENNNNLCESFKQEE